MKKNAFLTAVISVAAFAAIFGYWYMGMRKAVAMRSRMQLPPATVAVAAPRAESWHRLLSAVATLQSREGIVVKTELEGVIVRVAFQSGAAVKRGDLLIELDTSREEAQLKGLIAAAQLAEASLRRARELRETGSNSPADLDAADASYSQAVAACDQLRVVIAKKRITAPFSGRLGITQVSTGQFLRVGDEIVQLESVDPIYADFGLPQQDISLLRPGLTVQVTIDAFPGKTFSGVVEAINPRVNDATRNIRVRAVLPNADEQLHAGMFGRAELSLSAVDQVLVIPAAAVVYSPYGNSVFVVENGVAKQKFVQTGSQRGDIVVVSSGLAAGDQVVVAGAHKLRNNMPARVDNSVIPDANPAPSPKES
jgi:membrane fusion protein (multidrug efflux system)